MLKRIAAPVIITAAVIAMLALGAFVAGSVYQHVEETHGIETGAYQVA